MKVASPGINGVAIRVVCAVRDELRFFMQHQTELERVLGRVTRHKPNEHDAYEVDDLANRRLLELLSQNRVGARVFTEESGWQSVGKKLDYRIVSDPFCNTSLAMRTFRESVVTIFVADNDYRFITCVVGDLGTDSIYYADDTGAYLLFGDDATQERPLRPSRVTALEKAFVVVSAMKRDRRRALLKTSLFARPRFLITTDGGIYPPRLAAGKIDVYSDPFKGQPLYEVTGLEIASRAGAIVTDLDGSAFNSAQLLRDLERDPRERYRFVAAATPELHRAVLNAIAE